MSTHFMIEKDRIIMKKITKVMQLWEFKCLTA